MQLRTTMMEPIRSTTNVAGKISNGRGFNPTNGDGTDFITVTGMHGFAHQFYIECMGKSYYASTQTPPRSSASATTAYCDMTNQVPTEHRRCPNRRRHLDHDGVHYQLCGPDGIMSSTRLTTPATPSRCTLTGCRMAQRLPRQHPLTTPAAEQIPSLASMAMANVNMDFDGTIDEVRVSNASRSAGWVLTEYNNQNAPSTFYAVGTEAKTYYSLANGNWNTAATWSNISHTGAAASTAPGSADYVIIGNSDIVTLTVNVTNNTEVEINSTGTLEYGNEYHQRCWIIHVKFRRNARHWFHSRHHLLWRNRQRAGDRHAHVQYRRKLHLQRHRRTGHRQRPARDREQPDDE